MEVHHIPEQRKRREKLFDLYNKEMFDVIDDNGQWYAEEPEPGIREKLWHCPALLSADRKAVSRANNIILSLELTRCHFSLMTSMQILLKHDDKLQETVRIKLQNYVQENLDRLADDKIHYTMYNDNFAGLAIFTLLTAGELFNNPPALIPEPMQLIWLVIPIYSMAWLIWQI